MQRKPTALRNLFCAATIAMMAVQSAVAQSPGRGDMSAVLEETSVEDGIAVPGVGIEFYHETWGLPDPNREYTQACFAVGTAPEVVEYLNNLLEGDAAGPRYQITNRWLGSQGSNRNLTWSFVPDGLFIPNGIGEPAANSDLFARLDSLFASQGGRATWINRFEQSFNRWAEVSGVTYTRITVGGTDWDDGAAWGTSGAAGARGDIRISMKNIDGANNVLAYNQFPQNGDMVLDRSESWSSVANQHRFMRNIITHEHGHGLGILHVCPVNNTKLMEPFLALAFDGVRHDDIRAAQRHYGDSFEGGAGNNSAGAASPIGAVDIGSPITLGELPPPVSGTSPTVSSTISIDANAEQDWYLFSVPGPREATVTVTPRGISSYDSCVQTGSCPSGCPTNSLAAANLNVELIDTDGSTVLATANTQAGGLTETISGVTLPAAGDYYVRVYEGDAPSTSQLYVLNISVMAAPCQDPVVDPIADDANVCSVPYTSPAPSASGTPPFIWTLDGLPPGGMVIDNNTGVVSWPSPIASATPYTITVKALSQCGVGTSSVSYDLIVKPGDFDGDGVVTVTDIGPFVDHLIDVDNSTPCAEDVNLNTFGDGLDVQTFINSM
ncbi:MAG: matrixin family metalloprotease [Planctomycetia bacterium]|jgi:hypothetical protein|nr:matrixin family metalloprotease [Planctomycetia bacterium]MCC7315849.1 matrixin family metalloprotease [Planctomycetota bacterium]OQZ03856.1 MAG: hypothetical protein B6D36_12330 [Planctomycetes bacterium UTPLA1]